MTQQSSRAVRIHAHGGPEQLVIDTVTVGDPGPGEVRIRHHAIGLNFIDVCTSAPACTPTPCRWPWAWKARA